MSEDKIIQNENMEIETDENIVDTDDNIMSLEEFLVSNSVEGLTEEIVLSERLKNFKFKIGSMTKEELEKYRKACTIRDKKGNVRKQDPIQFNELVVINHCLYPNFKSQDFINKLKVHTPAEALSKTLKVGELTTLAEKIMQFNGFEEYDDIREKAKN